MNDTLQNAAKSGAVKKKRHKTLGFGYLLLILWIGLWRLVVFLLAQSHLSLRAWAELFFALCAAFGLLLMLALSVIKLLRWARAPSTKAFQRVLCVLGAMASAGVMLFGVYFGLLMLTFSYHPEHVAERNDRWMVAQVHAFLDVDVYYYDYVNFAVRGKDVRVREYYGSGGYDPFTRDVMPTPKEVKVYD